MDSMGAMLLSDVRDQMHLLSEELFINVGFHTYNNPGLIIGNTLAGIKMDATTIDGCLRELGARSGNDQMEVLTGVLEKTGYDVDPDFFRIIDVVEVLVDSGEMEVVDGQEDFIIDIAARLWEGGQVGAGCYD
jgi:4-hydroxy 2-oxovalerate aldolase